MFKQPDDNELPNAPPVLKLEAAGGDGGKRIKTVIGLFDDGNSIDPRILTKDPPLGFAVQRSRAKKHYYEIFRAMPKERALQIFDAVGIPPLCILALGLRWQLLTQEDFDYLDLQAVFELAGHDVSTFGKTLDKLETRSLYHLYKKLGGCADKERLQTAGLSGFNEAYN